MGESMKNLLHCSVFESLKDQLEEVASKIKSSKVIHLIAPADIEGVLALAQIESALLDNSQNYTRRILPPRRHVSRDQKDEIPDLDGLIIHISPFSETQNSIKITENYVQILPVSVTVSFEKSTKVHNGAVECVSLSAVIAEIIAPNGARVRKQRSMSLAGSWLRSGADANYDPVLSIIRDHLHAEGSIEIRPLPEVPNPVVEMVPGLSKMMLNRLRKGWPEMDLEQRSSAISELVLPTLRVDGISTMRLEELIWHRAMISGNDIDIASQIYAAESDWPDEETEAKVHASTILDSLIVKGHL